MISSSQEIAYFLQRVVCFVPGDIHAHLSREGNGLGSLFGLEIGNLDVEKFGNRIQDIGES
jgi:hypothetical protein